MENPESNTNFLKEMENCIKSAYDEKRPLFDTNVQAYVLKKKHKASTREYDKAVMLALLSLVKPQPQPQLLRQVAKADVASVQNFVSLLDRFGLVILGMDLSEDSEQRQIQLLRGVSDAFIEKHALFAEFYPAMVKFLYDNDMVKADFFLKWETELKKQTGDCWADLARRIEGLFEMLRPLSDEEEGAELSA